MTSHLLILSSSSPQNPETGKESAARPHPQGTSLQKVSPCVVGRCPHVDSDHSMPWLVGAHGAGCVSGRRQGRGSACRRLTKGQVGEAPPCLGVPGATGHFWHICL